jgi:ssDNA-binding Zn-finger/Zn-ribbon topoisomerase 1
MICPHCGEEVIVRGEAYNRHVVVCAKMPETDVLVRMVKRGRSYDSIGRDYGVSGRAVRRRVLAVDPFASKAKEVPRGFSKDRCKVCEILLTAPLAMPAEKNVCAMCIREAETAIHHRTATGSYERKQK